MTEEKKENKNVSVFARSKISLESDPLEEIFALNLGDFISEHLISDELIQKISRTNVDKSDCLKKQLKELISIYSIDNTLKILGFSSKDDYVIYNSIAKTIKQMLEIDACHIFLSKENAMGLDTTKNDLILVGSSLNFNNDIYEAEIGYNFNDESYVSKAFIKSKTVEVKDCSNDPDFKSVVRFDFAEVDFYAAYTVVELLGDGIESIIVFFAEKHGQCVVVKYVCRRRCALLVAVVRSKHFKFVDFYPG